MSAVFRSLIFGTILAGTACGVSQGTGPSSLPASSSSPTPAVTPTPASTPTRAAPPTPTPAATPTPNPGLAYNPDLKRVFDADCIGCHNDGDPTAGYSTATYSSIMKDVRPGDPNCTLVKITRSTDAMYEKFSGDRAAKAALVYDWVVKYGAAQNR